MKAIQVVKYGDASTSFQIANIEEPTLTNSHDVLIKVDSSGINFADVMARRGLYRAAPPLPAVLGYEVVGEVVKVKDPINNNFLGKRVLAMTRFGGYAELAVSTIMGLQEIPKELDNGAALALATQYCTAHYALNVQMNLFQGDTVLIHAASGGVGTALTQLAKLKGCRVIGLTRSEKKVSYLNKMGVDFPIVTSNKDYVLEVQRQIGIKKVDAIFNPVGGKTVKKDISLLNSGGKLVFFGISDRMKKRKGSLNTIFQLLKIGKIHPAMLLLNSHSLIGVNLLKIAEDKPEIISRSLKELINLVVNGEITPVADHSFNYSDIAQAHSGLEKGMFTGKSFINWT